LFQGFADANAFASCEEKGISPIPYFKWLFSEGEPIMGPVYSERLTYPRHEKGVADRFQST
jgi:hypothetical protein